VFQDVDIAYIISAIPMDSSGVVAFLTFFCEAAMAARFSGGSVLPNDAWPMPVASASAASNHDGDREEEITKAALRSALEQNIREALDDFDSEDAIRPGKKPGMSAMPDPQSEGIGSPSPISVMRSQRSQSTNNSTSIPLPLKIESAITALLREAKRLEGAEADRRIWSKHADLLAVVQVIHLLFCANVRGWDEQEGKRALKACLELQFALKKRSYGKTIYNEVSPLTKQISLLF
jgi:hypothetical protein